MKRHLLLLPDLPLTMGEGSVVALIQIYFVLRFHLLPGPLGAIFTGAGLLGGLFSLTAPFTIEHQPSVSFLFGACCLLIAPILLLFFGKRLHPING
ncbi:MAG TPA: hypothetical protein VFV38_26865 [Ktedonobacteraceae bacterium]|nr:hypothetical protein [Ktedonobacteraceae bacterium]